MLPDEGLVCDKAAVLGTAIKEEPCMSDTSFHLLSLQKYVCLFAVFQDRHLGKRKGHTSF